MRFQICVVVFALLAASSQAASQVASLRCPTTLAGGSLSEAAEITALWKGLSISGMDGSDGPLGCPLDVKAISNDSGSGPVCSNASSAGRF
jgi:hypothetical protein